MVRVNTLCIAAFTFGDLYPSLCRSEQYSSTAACPCCSCPVWNLGMRFEKVRSLKKAMSGVTVLESSSMIFDLASFRFDSDVELSFSVIRSISELGLLLFSIFIASPVCDPYIHHAVMRR